MRIKERREYWRVLVEEHANSGMTAVAFCKAQKINPQRFYSWRKRFSCESHKVGFVQLVPTLDTGRSGIRILLDQGMSVEVDKGFDPVTLRETIDALCNRG